MGNLLALGKLNGLKQMRLHSIHVLFVRVTVLEEKSTMSKHDVVLIACPEVENKGNVTPIIWLNKISK